MRASLTLLLWLKYGVWLVAGYAVAWGAAVLVARAAVGLSRADLAWGAAGLPVMLAGGLALAVRHLPGAAAIRSVLDRQSRAGGLLMAEGEADIASWRDRLPTVTAPRLRWRGGPAAVWMLAAMVFVGAAFAVPDWWVEPLAQPPLDISAPAGQLQQQIDTLAQERILGDDQARAMRDELDQLQRAAMGAEPVHTWEALDHLRDTVDQAGKTAAEEALRRAEAMADAEQLAEAVVQGDLAGLEPEMVDELAHELAELLERLAREQPGAAPPWADQLKQTTLSPEQMQQLLDALRDGRTDLHRMMQALYDVDLADVEALRLLDEMAPMDSQALREFLEREAEKGNCSGSELASMLCQGGGLPGHGGISRGRGDAPMIHGPESSPDGVTFKEKMLPPAQLAAIKDSQTLGVTTDAPEVDAEAQASAGGALDTAASGGGSAVKHPVLPRHRGAVGRYFDREAPKARE